MLQQKIFIASPGDVCDERGLVRSVVERIGSERAFRDKLKLDIIAWDQPGAGVAMQAAMTPQKAIAQGLPKPSECDIVIVIFWSRIGTILPAEYKKFDGSRYLSGTEWEYCDALESFKKHAIPEVWVYRRSTPEAIRPDDTEFDDKREQWKKLESFFNGFNNADDSIRSGVNHYQTPEQFRQIVEGHLRNFLTQQLEHYNPPAPEAEKVQQDPANFKQWQGSPYPGLEAFKPDQSMIYFGRGREIDKLLEQLMDTGVRFVAVIGASGSGKSSLVSAGLIPRLKAGARPGSERWLYLRFSPTERGNNPFLALTHALTPLLSGSGLRADDLAQTLYENPRELANKLTEQHADWPQKTELVLFIDQFEELFSSVVDEEHRQGFIRFLQCVAQSPGLRTVATMRSDFFATALEFEVLSELFRGNGTLSLAAPGAGALYEMVSGPAKVAGLQLQEGLVDAVLQDTGNSPGALPLMAFALNELYLINGGKGELTLDDYKAIGKVKGAIARRAASALSEYGGETDKILDSLFPELVNLNAQGVATRARAKLNKVANKAGAGDLIEHLITARLLTTGTDKKQTLADNATQHIPADTETNNNSAATLEIAHESLLQNWPLLHNWIKTHRDRLTAKDDLLAAAQAWERTGQPRWSGLPAGSILKRYKQAAPIPETAQGFFQACRFLERVRMTTFACVLAVFMLGIGFVGWIDSEKMSPKTGVDVLMARIDLDYSEPTMVLIPKGTFYMGDEALDKKERRFVEFAQSFYLSQSEVTFAQYDVFAHMTDRDISGDEGWGRGNRPVINVDWEDATAYALWLRKETGKKYRLPTEAEWEYAARADSETAYWWGDEVGVNNANCDGCGSFWDNKQTAPVGSFKANDLGLYDTAGNVWEWVQDCYDDPEVQAETDNEGNCGRGVIRGGSWFSLPRVVRSAYRLRFPPVYRFNFLGFRLAQDIN